MTKDGKKWHDSGETPDTGRTGCLQAGTGSSDAQWLSKLKAKKLRFWQLGTHQWLYYRNGYWQPRLGKLLPFESSVFPDWRFHWGRAFHKQSPCLSINYSNLECLNFLFELTEYLPKDSCFVPMDKNYILSCNIKHTIKWEHQNNCVNTLK